MYPQGWSEANGDFAKPVITVGVPYSNASSCNHTFRELGDRVVAAVERCGGKAFLVGAPVITDGMVMGAEGMKYSLPSRDLVADCFELMHEGYRADAMITIGGCDNVRLARHYFAQSLELNRSNNIRAAFGLVMAAFGLAGSYRAGGAALADKTMTPREEREDVANMNVRLHRAGRSRLCLVYDERESVTKSTRDLLIPFLNRTRFIVRN